MRRLNKSGVLLVLIGLLCVSAGLMLFFHNMWDDFRAGLAVSEEKKMLLAAVLPPLEEYEAHVNVRQKEAASDEYRQMPVKTIHGTDYVAMINIPALSLELPVRATWSYEGLKYSPCRYAGSAFMDDLVICAHNYSQHFGRIKDLETDSEILLVDMEGNLFRYRVVQIETLAPKDIREMIESSYDLTLFTCTLGGRTRVTVRCMRAGD